MEQFQDNTRHILTKLSEFVAGQGEQAQVVRLTNFPPECKAWRSDGEELQRGEKVPDASIASWDVGRCAEFANEIMKDDLFAESSMPSGLKGIHCIATFNPMAREQMKRAAESGGVSEMYRYVLTFPTLRLQDRFGRLRLVWVPSHLTDGTAIACT